VTFTSTFGDTMPHLCGHDRQPRAQAANMLKRLGVSAPSVDCVTWVGQP
jgi:uncharacterized damage-inducible protein DinB